MLKLGHDTAISRSEFNKCKWGEVSDVVKQKGFSQMVHGASPAEQGYYAIGKNQSVSRWFLYASWRNVQARGMAG
jgi:hypothetical protein